MELIERDGFLEKLHNQFKNISRGEGHCVFINGEAGIGKTSLVKALCKEHNNDCNIYNGACDALFTPRPLAPLYDIMWQVNKNELPNNQSIEDRSELFARFYREISDQDEKSIIVFEDIHWADEATLDFIKFFARRISHLKCLFILTCRDDEIHSRYPIRNLLGQLNADSFTRIQLLPLSKGAVEKLASEKGYDGENVYSISGGNPFYVNEILASYSPGIPDNIKDSILSVYNRQEEKIKTLWDLLCIIPTGFNIKYLENIDPLYSAAIQQSLDSKILLLKDDILFFKHELYRRTIETSLSPFKRIGYNKKILDVLMISPEKNKEIERIVHHAKNANEYETVIKYAPLAAKRAATVGAHVEASKLYLTAIEYYQGNDKELLNTFFEGYAYECYLTNQTKEAIIYAGKSLNLWKEKNDKEKIGNSLRFLSRLWWFEGNRKNAERFAAQAIEVLKNQPLSKIMAMAYSNMSQLKMLSDQSNECISWGEKAIAIAKEMYDEETVAHALNSIGSTLMLNQSSMQKGIMLLQQSLDIALKNSYHDQVARDYATLGSNGIIMKDYVLAKKELAEGIQYCEERDLDSLKLYMLSWSARLNLETGNWKEAYSIADNILKIEARPTVVKIGALTALATIKMRRGDSDALPLLLETEAMAFEAMELQRISPALAALLEYEWLTGKIIIKTEDLNLATLMIEQSINSIENNEFAFWLLKVRKQHLLLNQVYEGYEVSSVTKALKAAAFWQKTGNPYMEALSLFEGNDDDKRKAISIVHALGANAVYDKMKMEMRNSGIKSIPRGLRKSTQSNPAFITKRELDVLALLKDGMQNKEIASKLFLSAKTVDHHISSILFKLDVNSRIKAVAEAVRMEILN